MRVSNLWRRRSTWDGCLMFLSIFALVAQSLQSVVPLNSTSGETYSDAEPQTTPSPDSIGSAVEYNSSICFSAECVHTASDVLSKMKPEVDPCSDFYQFACGRYIDEKVIPSDKNRLSIDLEVADSLQEQLKVIIAEQRPPTDPKHLRLPNDLYKSCMNLDLIELLGSQPITNISNALGGWPVVKGDAWDLEGKWSWQDTDKKLRKLGFTVFYVFDLYLNNKRVFELEQPALSLSRESFLKGFNESQVTAYYDHMVDTAVLFGADRERARQELAESLQFEIALANISVPNEKRSSEGDFHNPRTIKQMLESYPYVQWLSYINALLPEELALDENELINLAVPSFFEELGPLLSRTPKRVIANYLFWRVHSYSLPYLSKEFRKQQLKYYTKLWGTKNEEARSKQCTGEVKRSLAVPVGSLYVQKHFKADSQTVVSEMFSNIHRAFAYILNETDWMDSAAKSAAEIKLQAMSTLIGYPDEIIDNNKLEEYYRELDINADKYFISHLRIQTFKTNQAFRKLRSPVNKTEDLSSFQPTTVNVYYSLSKNSIYIPAGILQGPYFNAQRPMYMNYGALGSIIGQRVSYGFDNRGRQYDAAGNLVDWWQPETEREFLERTKCIVHQYYNYTDKATGLKINGNLTKDENVADNGGIKGSYIAYRQWAATNGPELKLPGLSFTPEQMFWISAAQMRCAKYTKEAAKFRSVGVFQAPPKFRVLGSISNREEFASDFQCPQGSPMNPTHKCEVW